MLSNSKTQKIFIDDKAKTKGLSNVEVRLRLSVLFLALAGDGKLIKYGVSMQPLGDHRRCQFLQVRGPEVSLQHRWTRLTAKRSLLIHVPPHMIRFDRILSIEMFEHMKVGSSPPFDLSAHIASTL
jgi:hypothetical protein